MAKRTKPMVYQVQVVTNKQIIISKLCVLGAVCLVYAAERIAPGMLAQARREGTWRSR